MKFFHFEFHLSFTTRLLLHIFLQNLAGVLRWRWITFIAQNLVAIARTCTKFHMRAKFDILHVVVP